MHKKQFNHIEMKKIIDQTSYLLLKRDMSLNRRIYSWFLGTDVIAKIHQNLDHSHNETFDEQAESFNYYLLHTREELIECLRDALRSIILGLNSNWTMTKLLRVLLILGKFPFFLVGFFFQNPKSE